MPALAVWLGSSASRWSDLGRLFRAGEHRVLAAAALAALVSMLAAGLFEYNFGDSEFLMLLLMLITLPFAAIARPPRRTHDPAAARPVPRSAARRAPRRAPHRSSSATSCSTASSSARVTRISPEAPVPVVRFRIEHVRLGGAANVAHNLAALGARVSLVGLVGRDAARRSAA